MPNWVTTRATVTGPADKLNEFVDRHFKDGTLSFETVIPPPARREDCPDKYILSEDDHVMPEGDRPWLNWYEWNCDNWGCKWDCSDFCFTVDDDGVHFSFNTPWAFPAPVAEKLSELHPDLEFTFEFADEDIGRNCGVFVMHNATDTYEYVNKEGDNKFACEIKGYDYDEFREDYPELEDKPVVALAPEPVAMLEAESTVQSPVISSPFYSLKQGE